MWGKEPDVTDVAIRSPRPAALAQLVNPLRLVAVLWLHRDLIRQFTHREVVQTYRSTYLGVVWVAAQPLLVLAVYTFVFSVILNVDWRTPGASQASPGGTAEDVAPAGHGVYALTLFCGLLLLTLFSESIGRAPSLLADRRNLVRRVVFPIEILPVTILLTKLVYLGVSVLLVLVASLVMTGTISKTAPLFVLVLVPLMATVLGISWILASVGVFVRDVQAIVGVIVRMLFFMTPIFYPITVVPEKWRFVLYLNPLTHLVESARRTLLWGQYPEWSSLAIVWVVSLALMMIGYIWFMRTKPGFADVL